MRRRSWSGWRQAGLSWHIYEGLKREHRPDGHELPVCSYFYWCYANRFKLQVQLVERDFLTSAKDGKLPEPVDPDPDGATCRSTT